MHPVWLCLRSNRLLSFFIIKLWTLEKEQPPMSCPSALLSTRSNPLLLFPSSGKSWQHRLAENGMETGMGWSPEQSLTWTRINKVAEFHCGFKSLFQGDHLGVEYALSSHSSLLQGAGLLHHDSNILRGQPFPRGPIWEGFVIDDYFVLSRGPARSSWKEARSVALLERAEDVYNKAGVIGSDDKTVRGSQFFKIIGAEIQSDGQARDANVITVGAPASKRVPMCALSFKIASMPMVTRALASRLAGNWTSILMFRRPPCCLLDKIFSLGLRTSHDAQDVVALPRVVAEEIVLASVLSFVAITDISAPYDDHVYATDASSKKGGITEAKVKSFGLGDRKGSYTMLDNPARSALKRLGVDVDDSPVAEDFGSPAKSLDFCFDFVEICGALELSQSKQLFLDFQFALP